MPKLVLTSKSISWTAAVLVAGFVVGYLVTRSLAGALTVTIAFALVGAVGVLITPDKDE
jgi:hypothetical protein